jgi:predicted Zn-dependent peptidase
MIIKSGSNIDKIGKQGTSHLFEHLVWFGLNDRSKTIDKMENIGFQWNGETHNGYMYFYFLSDKTHVLNQTKEFSEFVDNFRFTENMFKAQKRIVQAEFFENLEQPSSVEESVIFNIMSGSGNNHKETMKSLDLINPLDVFDVYRQVYVKGNIEFIVTGDYDKKIQDRITKILSKMKPPELNISKPTINIKNDSKLYSYKTNYGVIARHTLYPSMNDIISEMIYDNIMTGFINTKLNKFLRDEISAAYDSSSSTENGINERIYYITFCIANKNLLNKIIKDIKDKEFMSKISSKWFIIGKQRALMEMKTWDFRKIGEFMAGINSVTMYHLKYDDILDKLHTISQSEFQEWLEKSDLFIYQV